MLSYFKGISKKRSSWLFLAISIVVLEGSGLFLQYVMYQLPCALCIYIRLSLFGILLASLIALIAPKYLFRYLGIVLWIWSALQGLLYALSLVKVQYGNALTVQCELGVQYPSWLPLDKWFPWIFQAYGDCTNRVFTWLSLGFSQWMVIIFILYLGLGILVLLAQFKRPRSTFR